MLELPAIADSSDGLVSEQLCAAAAQTADALRARAIFVFTRRGVMASLLSRCRPDAPIFAFTGAAAGAPGLAGGWWVCSHGQQYCLGHGCCQTQAASGCPYFLPAPADKQETRQMLNLRWDMAAACLKQQAAAHASCCMHWVACSLPGRQNGPSSPNRRWGVCPFRMDFAENPTSRIYHAFRLLKARGLIATGDLVVVVADVREEWADGQVDTIRSVQVGVRAGYVPVAQRTGGVGALGRWAPGAACGWTVGRQRWSRAGVHAVVGRHAAAHCSVWRAWQLY